MSFQRAAALARDRAADARRKAAQHQVARERVEAFDRHDKPALIAWMLRRIGQEMDQFATELERQAAEDVTVSERGPRR